MKTRKIPMRKCVVSNEMKPKKELVRIVKNQAGEIAIDPTGRMNGRGAYVSMEPALVQKAWKQHILEKYLEIAISDAFYKELFDYVEHQKARSLL
ncbi:MAG: YlxR family protein [Bacilli bacterium]|nr:YlxR family protein [Bacilli bacterium]